MESSEPEGEGISVNTLNRLIGISSQLSVLNEKLRTELQDSRQSSRELLNMLDTSKKELDGLRQELGILKQELEVSRNSSMELLIKAENSQSESAALQAALRKAESSLMSLELSFAAYREAAEDRINVLSRQNRLLKWGCTAAGILAVGFGTAFFIGK